MKICIIGSNGQLGSDLCEQMTVRHEITALNHSDIEITDASTCFQILKSIHPEVVLNTAAFHNVPKCEEQPELAMRINIQGAKILAQACDKLGATLIHISTDYVFDGKKKEPYLETDHPRPLNFYGITKLAGEHAVRAYCPKHKIIRVSGIYGRTQCRAKGSNFVSTMLKLSKERKEIHVVHDEYLTPTNTRDIAKQLEGLLDIPEQGIFHVSNSGQCSWYEFARTLFDLARIKVTLHPVPAAHFPSPVKRPAWSVLENARLKQLSLHHMPDWRSALEDHLQSLS